MSTSSSSPALTPWHAVSADAALAGLGSRAAGLSELESAARLKVHGRNRLEPPGPTSALVILRDQLTSIVVFLLIAAAAISLALGDRVEAAAIAAVLLINTVIGFLTELRARRAMESLLRLAAARASVVREGQLRIVDAELLVPGDVVELDAGYQVPADARVIVETDLRTDEAALTGESLPVSKAAAATLDAGTPLAERVTMVYKGTIVSAGTARVVVVATGAVTELGRIGTLVSSIREERTPLEQRLDALGRRLVWLTLGVAALVAGIGAAQGAPLGLVIETAIALAVAAVPEALPAVATIALAVGMRRMARRQAIVRRLPAVETLGSTTVVCTDKTRTLTSGEMTVTRVWVAGREIELPPDADIDAADPRLARALEVAVLATRTRAARADQASQVVDPVDAAVQQAARRAGIDHAALLSSLPLRGAVPFSSERKLMASFHEVNGELAAFVKGAPRQLLLMSEHVIEAGGEQRLDNHRLAELLAVNEAMARRGLRVLALASGPVTAANEASLRGLTFHGFLGLSDPPAPGVKETIARLRSAGLRTVMVTGDQRITAEVIGRALGVLDADHQVIDGRQLETLTPDELRALVPHVAAFSRVTPEHKLTIVATLQAHGEIVAMLGDGVNDAPALRKADVGVAMGIRGTDVARDAAAIVLKDDRFETIAAAVEEGRVIFANIRKFVFYLFSCNVAEVLVLLVAGLAGLPLPLLPLQLLWLNMVTDTFPALALAMEPGDPDVMRRPPRSPDEAILSRSFITGILFYASLITAATLAGFLWALDTSAAHASTVAFMTLSLAQIAHLGNARSSDPVLSPTRALANPFAVGAVALSVGLQVASVSFEPLARVLRLVPLGPRDWVVIIALAAVPAVIGQVVKVRAQRQQARALLGES